MDAKYVYGSINQVYAGTLNNMADMAKRAGYVFFVFNDIVYHIAEQGGISNTGLVKSDIFRYL